MSKSHPAHRIELRLRDVSQLFNSIDPSPFNEKDLDHDAEDFIIGWAQEYPVDEPLTLRIHLEMWPKEDPTEIVREAIHNYFGYRAKLTLLERHRLLKQGQTSLIIGLSFLAFCIVIIKVILAQPDQATWLTIVRESLTIAGWVAMWRPMQIYLYDWWPIRRRERIFLKLGNMPVEIIQARGR